MNNAARAFYYQTHFDQTTDYLKSRYVDKNVSKQNQEIAAWIILIGRAVQDQYISYTWRFE